MQSEIHPNDTVTIIPFLSVCSVWQTEAVVDQMLIELHRDISFSGIYGPLAVKRGHCLSCYGVGAVQIATVPQVN